MKNTKSYLRMGLDWMDGWMDGWDGYTTTAVTPRASLQIDANKHGRLVYQIKSPPIKHICYSSNWNVVNWYSSKFF